MHDPVNRDDDRKADAPRSGYHRYRGRRSRPGRSPGSAMSGLDTLRELIGRHAHNSHGPSAIEGLMITATDAPTGLRSGIAEPSLGLVVRARKRTGPGARGFVKDG